MKKDMSFTEKQMITLLSRAHEAGQRSTGNDPVSKSANDYALSIVKSVNTVKLREVCPNCHSANINTSDEPGNYCYDCKSIWTRE